MPKKTEFRNAETVRPKLSPKRGVRLEYRTLDTDVWTWALAENDRLGKLPTKVAIQKYALEKYCEAGHRDFKASTGWYRRWKKRHKLRECDNAAQTISNSSPLHQLYDSSVICSERKLNSSPLHEPNNSSGICSNETLESFSIVTDKLISGIEMINSPSEFFDLFSESPIDLMDSNDGPIKIFMKELMDDFRKYFKESDNFDKGNNGVGKLRKKSWKYEKDFKDKMIKFISKHRIMEAATLFKISPETISIWMKDNKFQKQLSQTFIEESINTNVEREIRNKEREFCEWLGEKENSKDIIVEKEVKEKLTTLFSPTWSEKSCWFAKYCHKYLHKEQLSNPSRINYSRQFQKLMVNYASRTSQKRTASVFKVARKQLFNWVKNARDKDSKHKIDSELCAWYDAKSLKPAGRMIREKAEKLFQGKLAPKNSYGWYYKWCADNNISVKRNCDEKIVEWILAEYDHNARVSHGDVQRKALEIYSSQNEGTFKASTGWLLRFCRRYMNVLRRTPPLNAILPITYENSIKEIREKVMKTLTENEINENCYGVMDEILLELNPDSNSETQQKPLLRSCGIKNIQGTVILACLFNGTILPPILILKDQYASTSGFDHFSVIYHPKGIVDNEVMQFWLLNIWFKYIREPNLLLADCFEPHTSEHVKKEFEERKSHLIIIPAGCSSKLNPLTQIISPQFQEAINQHCHKWFEEVSLTWQTGDSSTLLSSKDIIDWVGKAYDSVNNKSMQENIKNVFKLMGIGLSQKMEEGNCNT